MRMFDAIKKKISKLHEGKIYDLTHNQKLFLINNIFNGEKPKFLFFSGDTFLKDLSEAEGSKSFRFFVSRECGMRRGRRALTPPTSLP